MCSRLHLTSPGLFWLMADVMLHVIKHDSLGNFRGAFLCYKTPELINRSMWKMEPQKTDHSKHGTVCLMQLVELDSNPSFYSRALFNLSNSTVVCQLHLHSCFCRLDTAWVTLGVIARTRCYKQILHVAPTHHWLTSGSTAPLTQLMRWSTSLYLTSPLEPCSGIKFTLVPKHTVRWMTPP